MKALKKVVRGVTLAELWATALTFVIMVVCYFCLLYTSDAADE